LPDMPQALWNTWAVTAKINERGLAVDVQSAERMDAAHEAEMKNLEGKLSEETDGAVTTTAQSKRFLKYLRLKGLTLDCVDRQAVIEALQGGADTEVVGALKLYAAASRAPKKPKSIINGHVGGRMRFGLAFYGASPTGRYAARGCAGAQLHNIARPRAHMKSDDCTRVLDLLKDGDVQEIEKSYTPLLSALADAQRGLYWSPDRSLVFADWSAIEGRIMPWLSGDELELQELEVGRDAYITLGAKMLGKSYESITSEERFEAKVAKLALQYGGGVTALVGMAEVYGRKFEPSAAAAITRSYRIASSQSMRWMASLWSLCLYALSYKNEVFKLKAGRYQDQLLSITYCGKWLTVGMPSGRELRYFKPRLVSEKGTPALEAVNPIGGSYYTVDKKVLGNNITQGCAADLLQDALKRAIIEKLDVVHHVHDEILIESDSPEEDKKKLEDCMMHEVDWARGLPLAVSGVICKRWRK
jgi:DNA polymerase bacteriophage-type